MPDLCPRCHRPRSECPLYGIEPWRPSAPVDREQWEAVEVVRRELQRRREEQWAKDKKGK